VSGALCPPLPFTCCILQESVFRGKPQFEHLKEELHVLVQCEDTEKRAKIQLDSAVRQVEKLLVPPPVGPLLLAVSLSPALHHPTFR
jgi:hypothetical protein